MCLGIPAEVIEIPDPGVPLARVAVGGVHREVATDLLAGENLAPGDWVLVHVGFALARIDAQEAAATIEALRRLGPVYEDEIAAIRDSAR